jgi:predicted ArsR family transcriptional regulator
VIHGYGCPLAAAAPDHPEVCRLMETLVAEIVGASVHERCDRGARPACRFEVTADGHPGGAAPAQNP